VVSAWEIALKCNLGKLELDQDVRGWIARASRYPGIHLESLSLDDAIDSVELPGEFHRDPADRIIVALARRLGTSLVTSDRRIREYEFVDTIW
ncbi:MAG: type II toxin-antitoxin system VapC family toxin, partial [Myxococcota bacterium]